MILSTVFKRGAFALIASGALLFMGASACSNSDDPEEDHERDDEIADECQSIGDVCTHGVPGAQAEECHEYYHANDAEMCREHEAECVAHCLEVGGGGHGGHGGAEL